MANRRQDELNLSLTGSQISARSVSSRPGSAKKANSMIETQINKVKKQFEIFREIALKFPYFIFMEIFCVILEIS